MFHTDDAMFLSKAVIRMPEPDQLEALGLWLIVGQWSAHEAAEGYCTVAMVHKLSPVGTRRTNTLIRLLCDVAVNDKGEGLWSRVEWLEQPAVLARDWDVWQDTADQTNKRRDSWREQKRRQREAQKAAKKEAEKIAKLSQNSDETPHKTSPKLSQNSDESQPPNGADLHSSENVHAGHRGGQVGDVHPDVRPPLIPNTHIPTNSPTAATHQSTAREPQPATPAQPQKWARSQSFTEMAGGVERPPPPDPGEHMQLAHKLVKATIPADRFSDRIRGKLVYHASGMLRSGDDPPLVEDALRLWLEKPHLSEAALPSLMSEVIKMRHAKPQTRSPSAKAQSQLDVAAELIAERQRQRHTDQPGALEA